MSGQLHAPAVLHAGKKRRYPLKRGLGGPHNWSRLFWSEESLSFPLVSEPQAIQLVAGRYPEYEISTLATCK